MRADADTAAAAVTAALTHLDGVVDKGWVVREGGVFAWLSGVGLPTLNGVLVESPDEIGDGGVASLLDRVARSGLPYCLQCRPAAVHQTERLAVARGMTVEAPIPLMVLENPARLEAALDPDGLSIRRAVRGDTELLATVGAAGFEAPEELFRELVIEAGFDAVGMRAYLGYCEHEPVATGMGLTIGEFVGIFNISALPGHRRRGFGAAMTARAVLDGLGAGASWSWLQSSPAGHSVYTRLGFRDIEAWACWVAWP